MLGRKIAKAALLERVPLFAALSRRQLEQVARLADHVEVTAGTRLATAGEAGHELYVIAEGDATAKTRDGRAVALGPGEFFGEMSLIDGEPRSATVEAATAMQVLVIGQREFWQLLRDAPQLNRVVMQALSRRLRAAERSVSH